jgi:hypothetical protein
MSDVKVAASYLHLLGEDGQPVVLTPGQVIPEAIAHRVTNPAAFTVIEEAPVAPPADAGTPTADAGTPTADAGTPEVAAPSYEDKAFADLQATAKSRGLSGAGTVAVLIARLEADDREKAAEAAADAIKTAANVAATTGTTE